MLKQFDQSQLSSWQLELIKKHPLIYTEIDGNNRPNADSDTHCNLRFGFEFDKGWSGLVDEFSRNVSELVVHLRTTIQPDAFIHAYIFKEKYGQLRWQGRDNLTSPFRDLFDAYVDSIEDRSAHICEITGTRGELRSIDGWLITLCNEEYAKRKGK